MTKNLTTTLLLVILGITDAYLLSHPNLIGRIGILIYRHDYLKTFPRALATVFLVLGVCLFLCEVIRRIKLPRAAIGWYLMLMVLGMALFSYVYVSFSSLSYSMTGKAFIYGAHLLPILMIGIFGRYLVSAIYKARNQTGI
ncbi:hypothetical protein [Persicitalea jodogahamensis]|uniref:Uncharacterized protein n=1 Tax=Persicitalea jodogahamensis TaxID=402147 RepID=A0A8J3G9Y5_9BACT|nr:hypothetical protein [Persicitalea jodogahamensis]GHB79215.1 hypothetical protein GCM10007390_36490 [Persicitalea jodogahamensis]